MWIEYNYSLSHFHILWDILQVKGMDRYRTFRKTRMAERAMFVYLWDAGLSLRTIAEQTGTSATTVRRWVKRWKRERNLCPTVQTQNTTPSTNMLPGAVRVWSQPPSTSRNYIYSYCYDSSLFRMYYYIFLHDCLRQLHVREENKWKKKNLQLCCQKNRHSSLQFSNSKMSLGTM